MYQKISGEEWMRLACNEEIINYVYKREREVIKVWNNVDQL